MFWRLHAQRLLVERGKKDVAADLVEARRADRSVDAIGLNPAAIHALWTLHGLGALATAGEAGEGRRRGGWSSIRSAGVRRNAVLVLPRRPRRPRDRSRHGAPRRPRPAGPAGRPAWRLADARLRPTAARARSSSAADRRRGSTAIAGCWTPRPPPRRATPRTFLKALARHEARPAAVGRSLTIVARVAEHYARGGPVDTIGALIVGARGGRPARCAEAIIAGFAEGLAEGQGPEARRRRREGHRRTPAEALDRLARPDARASPRAGASKGLDEYVAELAKDLLAAASDEKKPEAARIDAARQLIDLRKADPKAARDVIALVTPKTPPELASGLIAAVATERRRPRSGRPSSTRWGR